MPAPFHVEAYPRIDLRRALAEVRRGRDHVVWRDQEGELVGIARLAINDDNMLTIDAHFRGHPHLLHGVFHDEVACDSVSRVEGKVDVLTSCRSCKNSCRQISFRSATWLCRTCQELVYRSTILSNSVRETERLAELDEMLAGGRPRYMHRTRFEALSKEREWLRLMLAYKRARAPAHQRQVLTTSWRAEPPALLGLYDGLYSIEDTPASDVLELVGEPLFAGQTVRSFIEAQIRKEVRTVYARARAEVGRVSPLYLRRHFKGMEVGHEPVPGEASGVRVVDAEQEVVEARLIVPFEGEAAYFRHGLPEPGPARLPVGQVERDELILTARFSRANQALVVPLLEAELDLVVSCLERQRAARQQVYDDFHSWVKQAVAAEWPKLTSPRRRR